MIHKNRAQNSHASVPLSVEELTSPTDSVNWRMQAWGILTKCVSVSKYATVHNGLDIFPNFSYPPLIIFVCLLISFNLHAYSSIFQVERSPHSTRNIQFQGHSLCPRSIINFFTIKIKTFDIS